MAYNKIMKLLLIEMIMCISYIHAANIFCVFPMPAFSHQQPALTLSRALAAKGHNLTVINAYPSKVPIKNHRDVDISFLYKEMHSPEFLEKTQFSVQQRTSGFELVDVLPRMMGFLNSRLFASTVIQDLIREVNGTKFDLIIYEPMHITSLLGFVDLIGNPPSVALWTSHRLSPLDKIIGNPIIPSYMPAPYLPLNNRMTFWERFKNLIFELYMNYVHDYKTAVMNEKFMHENFGNVNRKLLELEHNTSLYITTSHLVTAYVHPVQPNAVYVGPLHIKQPEQLPADIQKWMDEAEDGVVYFSLGSNMKGTSVPENIRAAFIKSFKQFPTIRVLWKWESDKKLPEQPDNVLVKKWLPQQSVLAHPKTCLFISQVGLQSFDEATYYGVPILALPMFFDQDSNAEKVVSAGIGLKIEFHSIVYDELHGLLKELLTNSSYKENMRRLSALARDKPMSPVNTALWWVEYVLRHKGAPHLRPAALDLTWYQYYMVDILVFIVISVLAIVYIFYFIVRQLVRKLSVASPKTQVNKKKIS